MKTTRYTGRQQGDAFQELLCAEAADERTPAERLHALSKEGESIALEVARNPSASVETMKKLAQSESKLVRAALVQNPSATKEIFLLLLAKPDRVVHRALALYTHEREVIAKIEIVPAKQTRRALVANRGASYEFLRRSFSRWPTLARNTRSEWARSSLNDEATFEQCLQRMKSNIDPWLEFAFIEIARDEKATPEIIRQLMTLNSRNINTNLAMNPSTPRDILDEWANAKSWEYKWALASNRNLSPTMLNVLSKDTSVRSALAANPSTPESMLRAYATSRDYNVLASLVRNPSTPEDVLDKFVKQGPNSYLKWNMISNPNLPAIILQKLISIGVPPVYRETLERQPNMTDELRWLMNIDEQEATRMAQDPKTSPEILAKLSSDDRFTQSSARLALLKHPNTPKTFLEEAMQRVNIPSEERMCIAQNPSATPEMLDILAALPGKSLRIEIARHPNTSRETLEVLAQSKVKEIQEAAQKNLKKKRT